MYDVLKVIESSKSIFDGILKCGVCLWYHFLKILQILTPVVTSLIQNWVKRNQTAISCTNGDNQKMTIKSKRSFQVKYSFMKLFSRNLEIQAPCCDVIISKLGQRDSICISCTTGGKNAKIRTHDNLVHSKKEFFDRGTSESWNVDPRCEHNRWSILVIYSRANIALSNVTLLLSFSVLEFSKFASISPVTCGEGCVKRISDKWWRGGVGSENSEFCDVFFLEWSFMWCDLYEPFQIYI